MDNSDVPGVARIAFWWAVMIDHNRTVSQQTLFVLLLLFATAMQILVTPKIFGSPIRIALSDVLIPLSMLSILWWWRKGSIPLPGWYVPHILPGLGILTAWIAVSIINGWIEIGYWSTWALLSKGIGWIVLLSYFLVGSWLSVLVPPQRRNMLIWTILGFATFSGLITIVIYIAYMNDIHLYWGEIENYNRTRGFAENANAYGIMMAAIGMISLPFVRHANEKHRWIIIAAIGVCLAQVFFAGSRSATFSVIATAFCVGIFGLSRHRDLIWAAVATTITIGLILFVIELQAIFDLLSIPGRKSGIGSIYLFENSLINQSSDRHRSSNILSALTLWTDRPLMGIGLGSFLEAKLSNNYDAPSVLHNTGIWVLVEMGLIGVILFSGFFIYVVVHAFRLRNADRENPWFCAAIALLFVFCVASVGTEVLYQRYFWFLVGAALAIPTNASGANNHQHHAESLRPELRNRPT